MKIENYPEYLQEFLELYLNDVQLKVIDERIVNFYPDNLKNAFEILNSTNGVTDDEKLEIIEKIRKQSYDDFIVITTHIPKYLDLLKS